MAEQVLTASQACEEAFWGKLPVLTAPRRSGSTVDTVGSPDGATLTSPRKFIAFHFSLLTSAPNQHPDRERTGYSLGSRTTFVCCQQKKRVPRQKDFGYTTAHNAMQRHSPSRPGFQSHRANSSSGQLGDSIVMEGGTGIMPKMVIVASVSIKNTTTSVCEYREFDRLAAAHTQSHTQCRRQRASIW